MSNTFKRYKKNIKSYLEFLENDFDFSIFDEGMIGREYVIKYTTKNITIIISFDWENFIIIFKIIPDDQLNEENISFSLNDFIQKNCPHLTVKQPKGCGWTRGNNLEKVIQQYANIIKVNEDKLFKINYNEKK